MNITTESVIKNTLFSSLEEKTKVRLAGVIKKIDDKETAYAPVKRFKGDFVAGIVGSNKAVRAATAFFPGSITEPILAAARKAGKWSQLEFVAVAVKNPKDAPNLWTVTFEKAPQQSPERVLELMGD